MSETPKTAEQSKEAARKEDKLMEFVPHGGKDAIKLSVAIVKKLIAVPTKQGKLCSDEDAIKFIMMCQARRLNPFEGDAFLIGYDGKDGPKFNLITAHQAFLKRTEANEEYNGMKSGIIVKRGDQVMDLEGDFHLDDDVIIGGWATVYFKTREHPMHKRLRLSRFNTGMSQWLKDPAGMICKCAEADALRSSFPTLMGGMYLKEEMDKPETTAVVPIFKGQTEPRHVEVEEVKTTPLQKVELLCKSSNVTMEQVDGFMVEVGMLQGGKTIRDASDDNLNSIITNWADVVAKINEDLNAN